MQNSTSPHNSEADQSLRVEQSPVASQQPKKPMDELFSGDARRQYVALKELLGGSTAITKIQYDRIQELRWATRHLAIAELAGTILHEKPSPNAISAATHREVTALIQQCDEQQRQQRRKAMDEKPVIPLTRALLVRWLASAAVAGLLLGGVLMYLSTPQGGQPVAKPAEAYINPHTGSLVSANSESEKDQASSEGTNNCQPAFYCWKCRQWLPVKNPRSQEVSLGGPLQALSARSVVMQPNRIAN